MPTLQEKLDKQVQEALKGQVQEQVDQKNLQTQVDTANLQEQVDNSGVIDIADIENAPEITLPEPAQAPQTPIPSIESLFGQFNQESDAERTQNELMQGILGLNADVAQRDTAQAEANERFGVNALTQSTADLKGRLGVLKQKYDLIPQDVADDKRGVATSAGRSVLVDNKKAKAQKEFLISAAQLSADQGSLLQAQQLANQAVETEFEPIEFELEQQKLAYDMNKDVLQRDDSKKAALFELQLQERERIIGEEKVKQQQLQQFSVNASANGADAQTIQAIQQAQSVEEAIAVGGKFALDPQTVLAQKQFNESVQQNEFMRNFQLEQFQEQKRQSGISNYYKKQQLDLSKASLVSSQIQARDEQIRQTLEKVDNANKSAEKTKNTLSQITRLTSNAEGVDSAIGQNRFTRGLTPFTGKRGEFERELNSFLNGLTLENTKYLSGAMSDKDLELLALAASPLQPNEDGKFDYTPSFFYSQMGIITDILSNSMTNEYANTLPTNDAVEVLQVLENNQ